MLILIQDFCRDGRGEVADGKSVARVMKMVRGKMSVFSRRELHSA